MEPLGFIGSNLVDKLIKDEVNIYSSIPKTLSKKSTSSHKTKKHTKSLTHQMTRKTKHTKPTKPTRKIMG
jgi:hypothetical protein